MAEACDALPVSTGATGEVPVLPVTDAVPQPPGPVTVGESNSVAASVGINIHSAYSDTPYADQDQLLEALAELGTRSVRDGYAPRSDAQLRFLQRWRDTGGCAVVIVGRPPYDASALPDDLRRLAPVAQHLTALEGPNEIDLRADNWRPLLETYQRAIVRAAQALPALSNVPVVAPSLSTLAALRSAPPLAALADIGNLHCYPRGQEPTARLDACLAASRAAFGRLPVYMTETGYQTGQSGVQPAVSERAQAVYLSRLVLDNARAGVARTYLYELYDEAADARAEANFGLVRVDGSRKPAFWALRQVLAALRASPPGSAAGLPVLRTPAAAVQGSEVAALLLRRPDGGLLIALWPTDPLYDPGRQEDLVPRTREVIVTLPDAAAGRAATVLSPTGRSGPPDTRTALVARQGPATQLRVTVSDYPALIFLP